MKLIKVGLEPASVGMPLYEVADSSHVTKCAIEVKNCGLPSLAPTLAARIAHNSKVPDLISTRLDHEKMHALMRLLTRTGRAVPFIPEWVCSTDHTHRWRVITLVRVNGADCPLYSERGNSRVELLYFAALRDALGGAFSGLAMRSPTFGLGADVTVTLGGRRGRC